MQKQGELLFVGGDALALGYAAFRFLCCFYKMDSKLSKVYYSPRGYWKELSAIKKLANAAKVPEKTAKHWLDKQALWQIYLLAPRYVPRPKFDVSAPNASTKRTFFFCHTTSFRAAAQFTNTR